MTQKSLKKQFFAFFVPVILALFLLAGSFIFAQNFESISKFKFTFNNNPSSPNNPVPEPDSKKPDEKGIFVKFEQEKYTSEFISNLKEPGVEQFNKYYFDHYGLVILKNENYDVQKAKENYTKNQPKIQELFHEQIPNFAGKNVEQLIDHLVNIRFITYPNRKNANPEIIAKADKADILDILNTKNSNIILGGDFSSIGDGNYFYYKNNQILALNGLALDENLDYSSKDGWDFLSEFVKENRTNFQYYVADRMKPESVTYFNFDLGYMVHGIRYYSLDTSITDENDRLDLIKKMAQDFRLRQGNPNGIFEH